MEAILLRVAPGGRFHFGEVTQYDTTALEDTATVPHADVLFSALVNGLAQTSPATIEPFLNHVRAGRLRLSSGCYALEHPPSGRIIWFLPKPVSLNLVPADEPKKMRAVQFLSRGVWERGLLPDEWFLEKGECVVLQDTFVALKTELPDVAPSSRADGLRAADKLKTDVPDVAPLRTLFSKQTTPKVKARNAHPNREDGFYHQTDLHLIGSQDYRVGWYFLLDHRLPDVERESLDRLLTHVCLTGIGGERSTGCGALSGHQTYAWPDLTLPDTTAYATLSLTIPSSEADLSACRYYQVKTRGGRRVGSNQRLPMVQALTEGAVLDHPDLGHLADLTIPDGPPVLRYGYALTIPIHPHYLPHDTNQ